jgi:hypothetical protein
MGGSGLAARREAAFSGPAPSSLNPINKEKRYLRSVILKYCERL